MHSIQSPLQDSILAALQYQGSSNDCGPYTIATIVNSLLGLQIDAPTITKEISKPVWRGLLLILRRIPNWATFPWGIVDVFKAYGLSARWRVMVTPDELLQLLPQGIILMPVIGSWLPLTGHIMTLVTWSSSHGWGFANTQYAHKNITWLDDRTFRTKWNTFLRLLVEVKNA